MATGLRRAPVEHASVDYRQIVSTNDGRGTTLAHVTDQYRKALTAAVDDWNRTCAGGDAAAIAAARNLISEMLPDPSLGKIFGENVAMRTESTAKSDFRT
jgi:hypothetical protein